MSEMIEIISTLHDMEGIPKINIENIAKSMFEKMEIDLNDEMSLEQFTSAFLVETEVLYLVKGREDETEEIDLNCIK